MGNELGKCGVSNQQMAVALDWSGGDRGKDR